LCIHILIFLLISTVHGLSCPVIFLECFLCIMFTFIIRVVHSPFMLQICLILSLCWFSRCHSNHLHGNHVMEVFQCLSCTAQSSPAIVVRSHLDAVLGWVSSPVFFHDHKKFVTMVNYWCWVAAWFMIYTVCAILYPESTVQVDPIALGMKLQ
jgi:hypothetical protein